MWTLFWDMHSGGGTKIGKYDKIYIEMPEKEATAEFIKRFDQYPDDIACQCCGENFAVYEDETLEEASAFHRHKPWRNEPGMSVEDYIAQPTVLVLYADGKTNHDE